MNSKIKAYYIEAVTPPSDGKIVAGSYEPRRFFMGVHGVSTNTYTDMRELAELWPTKAHALRRMNECFKPGFMRVGCIEQQAA